MGVTPASRLGCRSSLEVAVSRIHQFLAVLALLALSLAVWSAPVEGDANPRNRTFNVRDYGAVLDGKADDAPAIMAAFAAMRVAGHPLGTLLIPGVARIASPLDLDGGYRNVTSEGQWSTGGGETLIIDVVGALRPDAGIGVAVKLHGARNVRADIRFDHGGKDGDIGLQVEDLDLCDLGVDGTDFAGILLYADASADRTKRIRSTKIHRVFASNCGQAIYWRGIEAFGSFEMVWDRNCTHGSVFKECADTGIQHYENFSPSTQTVGLLFEDCNMFQVGVLTFGDRAKEALIEIRGGDFGSIQRIRASGRPDRPVGDTSPDGLRLVNVKSVSIDNLQTFRCKAGLHAIGSTFKVKCHNSLTSDINPLVIEGSPQYPAPRMEVGAWYRYTLRESVRVLDNVTGGTLRLYGSIYDMNIDDVPGLYAIDCRSAGLVLDVAGLTQEYRANIAGSIFHPRPDNVRGVAQARLQNPLVHGQAGERPLAAGAVLRNASERTLCLWVTVRVRATADAAASAQALLGPDAGALTAVGMVARPAGGGEGVETLFLRVPPWWSYRVDVTSATVEKAAGYLE
jgi:hypothetical protein